MTHDPHLAEDVLQDTFVQLLISNVRLAPGKEQTWLYKVARNRCLDLLKKNRKHDELPPDVPADPDWNRTFIEMISPLTKSEQEIISLKFIGGFSHKEIAHITGTTVAAAKKRYERAIKKTPGRNGGIIMIEDRLYEAVQELPVPTVSFTTVKERAESISEELGITIPESLDGNVFCNITTGYVVPHGTSYLEALITPAYQWYSVDYGSDGAESLSFGSTKDELYQYCFDLNSENIWSPEHLQSGRLRTEEYKGITLQIGTVVYNDRNDDSISGFIPHVVWVDEENSAVFSLSGPACDESNAGQITDHLTETAKEIIDINTANYFSGAAQ